MSKRPDNGLRIVGDIVKVEISYNSSEEHEVSAFVYIHANAIDLSFIHPVIVPPVYQIQLNFLALYLHVKQDHAGIQILVFLHRYIAFVKLKGPSSAEFLLNIVIFLEDFLQKL